MQTSSSICHQPQPASSEISFGLCNRKGPGAPDWIFRGVHRWVTPVLTAGLPKGLKAMLRPAAMDARSLCIACAARRRGYRAGSACIGPPGITACVKSPAETGIRTTPSMPPCKFENALPASPVRGACGLKQCSAFKIADQGWRAAQSPAGVLIWAMLLLRHSDQGGDRLVRRRPREGLILRGTALRQDSAHMRKNQSENACEQVTRSDFRVAAARFGCEERFAARAHYYPA
jgi:hypothetical protein